MLTAWQMCCGNSGKQNLGQFSKGLKAVQGMSSKGYLVSVRCASEVSVPLVKAYSATRWCYGKRYTGQCSKGPEAVQGMSATGTPQKPLCCLWKHAKQRTSAPMCVAEAFDADCMTDNPVIRH